MGAHLRALNSSWLIVCLFSCGEWESHSFRTHEQALSSTLLVSQVYGGGGNSGASFTKDFVELQNVSSQEVALDGYSIQYLSAQGSGTWAVHPLRKVAVPPGRFFLVQLAGNTSGGTASLPTPDDTGTLALGNSAGKVALTSTTTALSGACPSSTSIIDLVGYGTANCFEGTKAAPQPGNTLSVQRQSCLDSDSNSTDFSTVTPNPRNLATPAASCGAVDAGPSPVVDGGAPPTDAGHSPDSGMPKDAGPSGAPAVDAGSKTSSKTDAGSNASRTSDAGPNESSIEAISTLNCACSHPTSLGAWMWMLLFVRVGLGRRKTYSTHRQAAGTLPTL